MPPRRDEMVDFPFYGIDGHYGQVERYLQTYGGMTFPDTNIMNSQQYLCQQLIEEPYLVILVTGPLTNLNVCHHLIKPTHRIFMMGGAIDVPGNVPAAYRAEFNFATDPDAVRNVISHGNSVIIPLDCKMRFFTDRVTNALKEKKNRFLIEVFKRFRQQVYRAVNGKEHDHECTEECISIYDAVASFVTYLTLFGGPIQLGHKSVTIDGSGAVIPGEHSVQYCASNSLDPLVKLREVRAAGTDTLIAALQAATKDFNEAPPTIAPTMPPAHVSARNYEPHSHSHDLGSTSRDSPWMERSDGESDAEDHHVTENPDFIGGRPIFDHSERTRLRDPSSSGEDWMERSGGAAGSTSVDYSGGGSSSHSNPDSSYPDTSYPDTPRSGNPGNPAYHFPVEDEDAPRYYDGGEISDSGPYRDDTVHGGNIFGPPPSSSPTMNQSPSSSRRPGLGSRRGGPFRRRLRFLMTDDVWYPSNNDQWALFGGSQVCASGLQQSPIDLLSFDQASKRPLLDPEFEPIHTMSVDTGYSLKWELKHGVGKTALHRSKVFNALQFHIHTGAEHTINGVRHDIEFHFVHQAEDGTLGVLGIICNAGESSIDFWAQLETSFTSATTIDAESLFNSIDMTRYFTYDGSLTTPPCSEGVKWTVVADVCTIPSALLQKIQFHRSMQGNYRTVQNLNGRTIGGVTDSALSLYRYGANYCIQLMRRTVGRMTSGLFMRISMCFHSWNTRSATLAVRYGEETWKQEAELPFDTSSKIGRYGIQWVPDRITWTVDGVKIGEVLHKAVDIPDSPLHIKIFVAPTVPRQDMKDLIEHQLHLYLADYEKLEQNKSKDELIVLGDSVDYSWRLWLLLFLLCVAVGIWLLWKRRKHQTVDGYILLEEDFNQI